AFYLASAAGAAAAFFLARLIFLTVRMEVARCSGVQAFAGVSFRVTFPGLAGLFFFLIEGWMPLELAEDMDFRCVRRDCASWMSVSRVWMVLARMLTGGSTSKSIIY